MTGQAIIGQTDISNLIVDETYKMDAEGVYESWLDGPIGTSLPTDASTDLGAAFTCLGYVSEDGLENANDLEVSEIKAWGGLTVYRSLNGLNDTFALKLIESENEDVLKTVYGDNNVTVDGSGNIKINIVAEDPQEKVWVFDMALRGGKPKRR